MKHRFPGVIVGALFMVGLAAQPARALPITDPGSGLTLDAAVGANIVGQTDVSPCVIGPPNCQNPAGFDFEPAGSGGGGSVFNETSPLYTVGQITTITGGSNAFTMLLDYNQTSVDQTLNLFEAIYFNGAVEISRQTFDIATVLETVNNGAGFSDFLITGFVIPGTTTHIQFHANWFNNDGADRYFIQGAQSVPCTPGVDCPVVPEPTSMLLLGIGFAGAAARALRSAKRS
jgi:hypothetical protein